MNPEQIRAAAIAQLMSRGMSLSEASAIYDRGQNTNTLFSGESPMQSGITSEYNYAGIPVEGLPRNSYDFINGDRPNVENQQPVSYTTTDYSNIPLSSTGKTMKDFTTKEEWVRYSLENGLSSPDTAAMNWDDYVNANNSNPANGNNTNQGFPLLYPGGSDISTELFTLGRGLGAPKGANGKVAAIVGGAGAALFDATRNVLSGVGYERRNKTVDDWYRTQQFGADNRNYTRAPQYGNANTRGNMDFEDGGMFGMNIDIIDGVVKKNPPKYSGRINLFEDGGEEISETEHNSQEEGAEQPAHQEQMMQVTQMISGAIQQGQSPQMIVQALVQRGMDPNEATRLVSMVVQQMQTQGQGQASSEPMATPEMKGGGSFKHKVGDYIEFEIGGEIKKGKIKRIENGQIFL